MRVCCLKSIAAAGAGADGLQLRVCHGLPIHHGQAAGQSLPRTPRAGSRSGHWHAAGGDPLLPIKVLSLFRGTSQRPAAAGSAGLVLAAQRIQLHATPGV